MTSGRDHIARVIYSDIFMEQPVPENGVVNVAISYYEMRWHFKQRRSYIALVGNGERYTYT